MLFKCERTSDLHALIYVKENLQSYFTTHIDDLISLYIFEGTCHVFKVIKIFLASRIFDPTLL